MVGLGFRVSEGSPSVGSKAKAQQMRFDVDARSHMGSSLHWVPF